MKEKNFLTEPELIEAAGGWQDEHFRSHVHRKYSGMCAMRYYSKSKEYWALFQSLKTAMNAATVACRHDIGGYNDVSLHPVAFSEQYHFSSAADWLFSSEPDGEPPKTVTNVFSITQKFMKELVRAIAANPVELAKVEWRDLERLLFEVLRGLGFDVTLTRSGKDDGFDMEIRDGDEKYLIELKHWSKRSRVGSKVIERFADVVVRKSATGLLLSSSGFTDTVARARLNVMDMPIVVRLGDHQKVIQLCRYFVESESGFWVPGGPLQSLLFENTF